MINKHFRAFSLILLCTFTQQIRADITHIFIDLSVLFHTNKLAAAKHVGAIASMRYKLNRGELPNERAFFNALKKAKAETAIKTYNEGLDLPFILADWLLSIKSNATLKSEILYKIQGLKISDIEKEVYSNVIEMMLTPSKLIDTLNLDKHAFQILQALSKQYIIILTANWDIESLSILRNSYPEVFSLASQVVVSGDIKCLKPHADFYECLCSTYNINPSDCLSLETEQRFVAATEKIGINVIVTKNTNKHQLQHKLQKFGIIIAA